MKLFEIYSDNDYSARNVIREKYSNIIKEYVDHGVIIYRGMRKTSDFIIADGSEMNRKSANTSNYTTILSTVLPSWKDWPKRNKSFICSLSPSYASGYGSVFYAIPLEGQHIAYCKTTDFWDALPTRTSYGRNIPSFNDNVNWFAKEVCKQKLDDTNANTIIETYQHILDNYTANKIYTMNPDLQLNRNLKAFIDSVFKFDNAVDFFDHALNPSENCYLYDNFTNVPNGRGEVWMSGKVLFIHEEYSLHEFI